jgi:hypothetical protein
VRGAARKGGPYRNSDKLVEECEPLLWSRRWSCCRGDPDEEVPAWVRVCYGEYILWLRF